MSPPGEQPGRRERAWLAVAAAVVALATLLAFEPVRHNGFVELDDSAYVTGNPRVLQGLDAEGLRWALVTRHAGNWHPLTWLSHMTDVELHGLEPAGHHATSLALHLLSALLLLFLVRRTLGGVVVPAAVAALFAVHPLRVESVAWVAERKDVLSTTLLLLAVHAWCGWVRHGGALRYAAVAATLALGLAAKPMLVTLPALLLLLDVWPLGRMRGGPPPARGERPPSRSLARLVLEKLPLALIAAAAALATLSAQTAGGAVTPAEALGPGARIANALVAAATYLGRFLFPRDLAAFYPHPSLVGEGWSASRVLVCGAMLLGITLAVVSLRRRHPQLLIGWLWYLISLAPVVGIVQVGAQSMADRYTYVPLIGPLWALLATGAELARRRPRSRVPLVAAVLVAVAACIPLTRAQVRTWRDTESLARRALAVDGRSWMAHLLLGSVQREAGRLDEAERHYRQALETFPASADALCNLALVRESLGDLLAAEELYRRALQVDPGHAEAHYDLGLLCTRLGRVEEAAHELELAAAGDPLFADARASLGLALLDLGRVEEAVLELRAALALDPDHVTARGSLGRARALQGDHAAAVAELEAALALDPRYPQALNDLALSLLELGREAEALARWEEMARVDPDSALPHYNLGLVHAGRGDAARAAEYLREALRVDPEFEHAEYVRELLAALEAAEEP